MVPQARSCAKAWRLVGCGGWLSTNSTREGPWILDDFYGGASGGNCVDWNSIGWWRHHLHPAVNRCRGTRTRTTDTRTLVLSVRVLGFDPFKEVIFLTTLDVAVAYHLGTSKVQFLGTLKPSTACMIRLCIHRVPPCVIADEYIRSASRSDISCVRQAASCMFLLWLEDLVYFLLTFVICLEPNQNNWYI
jgi:hypothetical protein